MIEWLPTGINLETMQLSHVVLIHRYEISRGIGAAISLAISFSRVFERYNFCIFISLTLYQLSTVQMKVALAVLEFNLIISSSLPRKGGISRTDSTFLLSFFFQIFFQDINSESQNAHTLSCK